MRYWVIADTRLDIPNAHVQRPYFTITRKVHQVCGIRGKEYRDQRRINRESYLWFCINTKPAYIFGVQVIPVYSTTMKQYSFPYTPSPTVRQSFSLEPKTYADQRIFDAEATLTLAKCPSSRIRYPWQAGSPQNHFSMLGSLSYHPVSDINYMRNAMRILCAELGPEATLWCPFSLPRSHLWRTHRCEPWVHVLSRKTFRVWSP